MVDISFTLEGDINAGRGALGFTGFGTLAAVTTTLWSAFPTKPYRYFITATAVNNIVILPEITSSNSNTNMAKIGNSIIIVSNGADSFQVQNHLGVNVATFTAAGDTYMITAASAPGTWIATNLTGGGGGGNILTAKGDLLTHDGANDVILPVGANGFILTADSTFPDGIKWAMPPATMSPVFTFDIVPGSITASSSTYSPIGYFAWNQSTYTGTTSMFIVAWINASGNRGIDLQVYNVTTAAEIGRISLTAGTVAGPYTTNGVNGTPVGSVYVMITVPVANCNIQIRTRKSANGGNSPTITGVQMHMVQ